MNKLIVLTGGGSGGHVTPNMALVPYLTERGYAVHYIGTRDGIERELVRGIPYHEISAGKLRRYASIKNISDPFKTIAGYFQAKKILRSLNPSVVFCKGGFVSVPVAFAAHALHIPVILHESDYTPGLANRLCAPKADKICLSFDAETERYGSKAVVTGSPIRRELLLGDRQKGLSFCNLSSGKPVLLVMGGSLGAGALNDAVDASLDALIQNFSIIHLRGRGNLQPGLASMPDYAQFEYIAEEMPDLLAAADIALSRAGAGAVFELLALKKPALLIPLPLSQSRGDQILNARFFEKNGYAMVMGQENLSPKALTKSLMDLYNNRSDFIRAMGTAKTAAGTENVLEVIDSMEKTNGY
jgi:UDP-N-acetylglucosamine--N-acetylmuramyl-(pentapeptide) pyrophosphoryl-undecaprenol N-acetylglucosamine transferase